MRQFLLAGVVVLSGVGLAGCSSRVESRPGRLGAVLPADARSLCPPQQPVSFDGLDQVRADMRRLECLLVLYENRPDAAGLSTTAIRRLYAKIVDTLAERNKWEDDSGAWEKLYDFTGRLNRIRNELARKSVIPVFSVNGHHMATGYWVEWSRRTPTKTLVHFDSHSDTRGLSDPKYVLDLGRRITEASDIQAAEDELSKYLNDPATPCSAGILILGFKNFVWLKPKWYGLEDLVNRPFFYGQLTKPLPGVKPPSKDWELYYDQSEDQAGLGPVPDDSSWIRLPKPARQMGQFDFIRRLFVSVVTTSPWPEDGAKADEVRNKLLAAIPKGRFILDIDLDYFGTVDLTPGMERKAPPSKYEERNEYIKPEVEQARRDYWKRHREKVDRELRMVEDLLRFLRDHGRIPSVVTLADSTYVPFALHWWAEEFWEYSPTRAIPYVQLQVRRMLQRVYQADGIGAVP